MKSILYLIVEDYRARSQVLQPRLDGLDRSQTGSVYLKFASLLIVLQVSAVQAIENQPDADNRPHPAGEDVHPLLPEDEPEIRTVLQGGGGEGAVGRGSGLGGGLAQQLLHR